MKNGLVTNQSVTNPRFSELPILAATILSTSLASTAAGEFIVIVHVSFIFLTTLLTTLLTATSLLSTLLTRTSR